MFFQKVKVHSDLRSNYKNELDFWHKDKMSEVLFNFFQFIYFQMKKKCIEIQLFEYTQ